MPLPVRDVLAVIGAWFVGGCVMGCLYLAWKGTVLQWRRRKLARAAGDHWQDLFDRTRPCPPFPAEN